MEKGRAQAIAFSIAQRGMTAEVRAEQVEGVLGAGSVQKPALGGGIVSGQ